MSDLKRFEQDLKNSAELRKKLDEIVLRLRNEGQMQSDGEAMVAAAKELGYAFTIADLERGAADDEELDLEEMDTVAGGKLHEGDTCAFFYHQIVTDGDDHNSFCITVWHCYSAMLHTDAGKDKYGTACWSDYNCVACRETGNGELHCTE